MSEDLPNDGGIVDGGDQAHPTSTVWTRQHIDGEGSAHEGRPAPGARLALFPRPVRSLGQSRHARRIGRDSAVCDHAPAAPGARRQHEPCAVVGRHPHVGVQIEALQVGLTRASGRHGLDIRLLPDAPRPRPGARAQRHAPLD